MSTRREYPGSPLLGVGALIIRGARVLLVRRGRPPHSGLWSVPGGLVEVGEDPKGAVRREIYEELGLKASAGKLFDLLTVVERDRSGSVKYHFVIIDYVTRTSKGPVRLNDESTGFGWFNATQVKRLAMTPGTKSIVLRFLKSEKRRKAFHG